MRNASSKSRVLKRLYNFGRSFPAFSILQTSATSSIFRAGNSSMRRSVASAISSLVWNVLPASRSAMSFVSSRLIQAQTTGALASSLRSERTFEPRSKAIAGERALMTSRRVSPSAPSPRMSATVDGVQVDGRLLETSLFCSFGEDTFPPVSNCFIYSVDCDGEVSA